MSGYGPNTYTRPSAPSGGAALGFPMVPILVGVVGSALVVIGSFLGWSSIEIMGETENSGGMEGDGIFTLLASGLAGVLLIAGLAMKNTKVAASSLLPTLITLVFAVLNFINPDRAARAEAEDEGLPSEQVDELLKELDVTAGVGLWFVLIGVLLALGGGAMAAMKARSN